MTPESRYIRRLVRAAAQGSDRVPPVPAGMRWPELAELLSAHRVTTLLAPLVLQAPAPESFKRPLERQVRLLNRRQVLLEAETARVLEAFDRAGIPAMLLKGMALGRTVYAHPHQRFCADIDLLAPRAVTDRACELLGGLGYAAGQTLRHAEFYERHHFHRVLCHSSGLVLELHWDLSRPADFYRFDLDGAFARSRLVDFDGARARIPSEADQLLHAACQSIRTGFSDLRRFVDAALLLRHGAAERNDLAEIARSQGMAPALWLLLELQRQLVGAPVPVELLRRIRPPAPVRACLASLALPEKTLSLYIRRRSGLAHLLTWLSAPDAETAAREIRRYLFPGAAELLNLGCDPLALPGPRGRAAIGLRHAWSLLKIAGYQTARLAIHLASPEGRGKVDED